MELSVDYFLYLVSSSYVRVGVFEVDRVWIYLRIPLGVVSSLEKRWLGVKVYEREGLSYGCALISGPFGLSCYPQNYLGLL